MSATKLKSVDVVVVGSGVVGSIMSMELASAGLSVVCLERGKQFDIEHRLSETQRVRRTEIRPPQRHLPEPGARHDHVSQQRRADGAADARDGCVQARRDGRRHGGALGRQCAPLSAA